MLGLAKEELVKEALMSLGAQIQTLANLEREDMKNITQNFIELKKQMEIENPEINLLKNEVIRLKDEFQNFKLAVSFLDRDIKQISKERAFKESIKTEEYVPVEIPKLEKATEIILDKMSRGDMSTEGIPERLLGYCISCEKEMIITNPEMKQTLDGGKMTTGPCIKCGRMLFRMH